MYCELAYFGKMGDFAYFDEMPWRHFKWTHDWLIEQKQEEKKQQEKQAKARQQASKSHRSPKPHTSIRAKRAR